MLEFQHSKISENEVNDRKEDYEQHDLKIIWIIDGNETISVKPLEHSGRIYLEFLPNGTWRYNHFKRYDFIFIDIGEKIYQVSPIEVKCNMIDVLPPKSKKDFIISLKNGENIYREDRPSQCNLFVIQQGAGSGKTYGIIQMLEKEETKHYKNFMIVTKQHTAKYIIYREFEQQIKNGRITHLELIKESQDGKKYIIKYKRNENNCQIIISTIDSFMCKIGRSDDEYD